MHLLHPSQTSQWAAGALLAVACAMANAQTPVLIPLQDIASIPATGLSDTVTSGSEVIGWTVDTGKGWETFADVGHTYSHFTINRDGETNQVQVWTFDRPVHIDFVVKGLNGPNEGLMLPAGTVLVSDPADLPPLTWDAGTRIITQPGASVNAAALIEATFRLENTTGLTLDGSSLGPQNYRRGLASLSVTPVVLDLEQPDDISTVDTPSFNGTSNLPEGTSVTLTIRDADNQLVATLPAVVDADGNYTATADAPLPAGTYTVTAEAEGLEPVTREFTVSATPTPTPTAATPVPTLGATGLVLLSALLGGLFLHRRRKA